MSHKHKQKGVDDSSWTSWTSVIRFWCEVWVKWRDKPAQRNNFTMHLNLRKMHDLSRNCRHGSTSTETNLGYVKILAVKPGPNDKFVTEHSFSIPHNPQFSFVNKITVSNYDGNMAFDKWTILCLRKYWPYQFGINGNFQSPRIQVTPSKIIILKCVADSTQSAQLGYKEHYLYHLYSFWTKLEYLSSTPDSPTHFNGTTLSAHLQEYIRKPWWIAGQGEQYITWLKYRVKQLWNIVAIFNYIANLW